MLSTHRHSSAKKLPSTFFLATCSVCHKIRDEEGNWCSPEAFLHAVEAGAVHTHTICRTCLKETYPEFWSCYGMHLPQEDPQDS